MNKLAITILAATALVPVSAAAEPAAAPGKHAGVSWKHGGARMGGQHQRMIRHHNGPKMGHHGNRNFGKGGHHSWNKGGSWSNSTSHSSSHSWNKGNRHGWKKGGHHRWKGHKFHRIDRGFMVPHFWWAPQFQVSNWQMYGFAQPAYGHRWIRYYDDALMIDQYGRVIDRRGDMDWDEYGDSWDYDDQGIPYYRDGEEYYDEGEWAEGDIGPGGYPPVPPPPCAHACPHSGYGYSQSYGSYGYGYGWMPGGMVTITETTVHAAAPQVETVYVKDRVKKKHRRVIKKARPRPGERG